MAWLTIDEVSNLAHTINQAGLPVAAPQLPGVKQDHIAIGLVSAVYGPFDNATRYLLLNAEVACCIAVSGPDDPAPTAQDHYGRMGANETRFIGVIPGGLLAVIESSVP